MTNWKHIKLGNISEVIGGGTPSTKNYDFWNGNIPWLTPKDLSGYNNRYISRGERNITKLGLQNSSARMLPKGAVLLTSRAPIGYIAIAENDVCTNQGFKSIVLKDGYCPEFFYYLLKNNIDYIVGMGSGSTFAEISGTQVKNLEFTVPPLDVQKKIAGVLGALDDKIELNNRINNNLEQQAQALFKSWFVDFEPFGGTMPKDWKESDIYSISNIIYGAPFASKLFNTEKKGLPIIRIRDLKNQHSDTYTEEIHPKAYIIKAGDIVVGMDGEFRPYIWGNDEGLLNQRVCVFENKRSLGKMFLYLTIKPLLNRVEQTEVATTVIHIGKQDFDAFRFSMPSNSILDKFDAVTQPIYNKIVSNSLENTRLASLRDTLLPKLMSGEIDVSNVDISALTSADKLSFTED